MRKIKGLKIGDRDLIIFGIIIFLLIPQGIPGQARLIQHLDATAFECIETVGNTVTLWKDQASFCNDAIISTGTISKVQEDGFTWLNFGINRLPQIKKGRNQLNRNRI